MRQNWFDRAEILLPLTMLMWAGNITLGRAMRFDLTPMTMSFWRWFIALIIVLIFFGAQARRDWPIIRQQWRVLLILGLTGVGAYNTFAYTALKHTEAINVLVMQSAMPVFVLLAGGILYRDRIKLPVCAGIVLSMLGALLIVLQGDLAALGRMEYGVGEIWMLAALIVYGIYTAVLRDRPRMHLMSFITSCFIIGTIVLLPFYIADVQKHGFFELTGQNLLVLGYIGLFPSFLADIFFNRGVLMIGSAAASPYFHFIPLFGAILAILFLGESLAFYHLIGGVLIFAGLLMNRQAKMRSGE